MTQRFREARRAYAAVTPAGYCLQYNTYQALISSALKVGAKRSTQAGSPTAVEWRESNSCGGVGSWAASASCMSPLQTSLVPLRCCLLAAASLVPCRWETWRRH
jgi:hypothetical protein